MTVGQLAQELRERQYQYGAVPRELIDSIPDMGLINSYITCSCCGEKQVSEMQLHVAIEDADDANHFFDLCDEMSTLHKDNSNN